MSFHKVGTEEPAILLHDLPQDCLIEVVQFIGDSRDWTHLSYTCKLMTELKYNFNAVGHFKRRLNSRLMSQEIHKYWSLAHETLFNVSIEFNKNVLH